MLKEKENLMKKRKIPPKKSKICRLLWILCVCLVQFYWCLDKSIADYKYKKKLQITTMTID